MAIICFQEHRESYPTSAAFALTPCVFISNDIQVDVHHGDNFICDRLEVQRLTKR